MSKLKYQPDLSNIKTVEDVVKFYSQAINQLQDILDARVEFDINIASQKIDVTFAQANTWYFITHKLNRKGLKFLIADKSISCDVAHDASRDNVSQICLSCTQATTVTIILI